MARTEDGDPRHAKHGIRQEADEAADGRARAASGRGASAPELDDPREVDGWSQPESSAQKGAFRDEDEG